MLVCASVNKNGFLDVENSLLPKRTIQILDGQFSNTIKFSSYQQQDKCLVSRFKTSDDRAPSTVFPKKQSDCQGSRQKKPIEDKQKASKL